MQVRSVTFVDVEQWHAPTTQKPTRRGRGKSSMCNFDFERRGSKKALHPATRDPTREYWISIEFRGRVNRQNRWTTDNMGDDVLKEETIILPSSH